MNDDIFTQALVRLAEPLRRRAYRLTHNQSEADDLLQETMTRAWSARFSFRAGSSLQAWTFTILRNLFLTRLRRSRHMVNLDDLAERLVAADANQHEVAELGEVMAAISRLPPDQRSALSAVSLEGFDYATAAENVNRRPKRTPYRRAKGTPFVELRDRYGGRAVRAGCGVGRA
ncbi:MAG: RNA polymerase sigma factor [Paracoccaceae bacterium]